MVTGVGALLLNGGKDETVIKELEIQYVTSRESSGIVHDSRFTRLLPLSTEGRKLSPIRFE